MVELLNKGDKKELRAFLKLYARPIFERALMITEDAQDARAVSKRVMTKVVEMAARGELREDIDAQLMELTDAYGREERFLGRLVDDAMTGFAGEDGPDAASFEPEARPSAVLEAMRADEGGAAFAGAGYAQAAPIQAEASPPEQDRGREAGFETEPPLGDGGQFAFAFADEPAAGEQAEPPDLTEDGVPRLFDESKGPGRKRRRRGEPDELWPEEEDQRGRVGAGMVILIILLSLVVVALVWILIVKLMTAGVIENVDFGFADWFNRTFFKLY